jgi:hypothetical protein
MSREVNDIALPRRVNARSFAVHGRPCGINNKQPSYKFLRTRIRTFNLVPVMWKKISSCVDFLRYLAARNV